MKVSWSIVRYHFKTPPILQVLEDNEIPEPCQESAYPLKTLPEVLEDINVSDWPGVGVKWKGVSIWTFYESFMKIYTQEAYQDYTYPPKLFPGVFEGINVPDGPVDAVKLIGVSTWTFCEIFMKIHSQEPCQASTYPPSLILESWRIWRFLTKLKMVSWG